MYYLNKIIWFFLNPLLLSLAAGLFGAVVMARSGRPRLRRMALAALFLSLSVLWLMGTATGVALLGLPLERPYLGSERPATLPTADAIVLLGGGMSYSDDFPLPDMNDSADRVWQAARLWKAGKAPVVVASGTNSLESTVPLLLDLGVPRAAVVVDNVSRNTYENSRFTENLLQGTSATNASAILLVTSAWHMTRARGNFAKTKLRVIPSATDFRAHGVVRGSGVLGWLTPAADNFSLSVILFKEWVGRMARR